jgi:predicted RNase H-like HicB family nuclease
MNEYVASYERADDGGWGAYIPDVSGVVAVGSTRNEVASGIKEALEAFVEDLHERAPPVARRRELGASPSTLPISGRV